MATKFYLAEIPDDFPATNVKFENMTSKTEKRSASQAGWPPFLLNTEVLP